MKSVNWSCSREWEQKKLAPHGFSSVGIFVHGRGPQVEQVAGRGRKEVAEVGDDGGAGEVPEWS